MKTTQLDRNPKPHEESSSPWLINADCVATVELEVVSRSEAIVVSLSKTGISGSETLAESRRRGSPFLPVTANVLILSRKLIVRWSNSEP